ncbi:MAG: hypothetical protein RL885_17155 [Planctomycetota bacterium]
MTDPAVFDELEGIYRDTSEEIARLGPVCELSGLCCRFDEYGHDLFATELEVDWVLAGWGEEPVPEFDRLCPFYVDGRCVHRSHRPLGCRIFFCDPSYRDAMPEVHERFFRRIRNLHERHGIPYRYGPFLKLLRQRIDEASRADGR